MKGIDFIKMLLAFGADVNLSNHHDKTPLDVCSKGSCAADKEELAALLKDYGAVRGCDLAEGATDTGSAAGPIGKFVDVAARETEDGGRASPVAEKIASSGDTWSTQVAKQFYEMEFTLSETLGDVTTTLSLDTLDKAASVGFQIREMKMLQMAGSRVLCLDGGGMRSLLQVDILCRIEKQAGRKITEMFDWIIGTSTGAVIALMIVHGKVKCQSSPQSLMCRHVLSVEMTFE